MAKNPIRHHVRTATMFERANSNLHPSFYEIELLCQSPAVRAKAIFPISAKNTGAFARADYRHAPKKICERGVRIIVILMTAFGTKRSIRPHPSLSAIGVTADIGGFWREMVCPLLTQRGHRWRASCLGHQRKYK